MQSDRFRPPCERVALDVLEALRSPDRPPLTVLSGPGCRRRGLARWRRWSAGSPAPARRPCAPSRCPVGARPPGVAGRGRGRGREERVRAVVLSDQTIATGKKDDAWARNVTEGVEKLTGSLTVHTPGSNGPSGRGRRRLPERVSSGTDAEPASHDHHRGNGCGRPGPRAPPPPHRGRCPRSAREPRRSPVISRSHPVSEDEAAAPENRISCLPASGNPAPVGWAAGRPPGRGSRRPPLEPVPLRPSGARYWAGSSPAHRAPAPAPFRAPSVELGPPGPVCRIRPVHPHRPVRRRGRYPWRASVLGQAQEALR